MENELSLNGKATRLLHCFDLDSRVGGMKGRKTNQSLFMIHSTNMTTPTS